MKSQNCAGLPELTVFDAWSTHSTFRRRDSSKRFSSDLTGALLDLTSEVTVVVEMLCRRAGVEAEAAVSDVAPIEAVDVVVVVVLAASLDEAAVAAVLVTGEPFSEVERLQSEAAEALLLLL